MMEFPCSNARGNHWSHSSSSPCVGDFSMTAGFSLDPLEGLGYAPREGGSSTREGPRREPLIGAGDDSGVLPSPRQGLLDQGQGLTSRTQTAMGIRCEPFDSTVFSVKLVNKRPDEPCRKQVPSDLSLWQLRRSQQVRFCTALFLKKNTEK